MFELKEVTKAIDAKLIRTAKNNLLTGVSTDTRTIRRNDIFFAIKGDKFNGHNFIKDAANKGATAIVVSEINNELPNMNILKVNDATIALAKLARYYRQKINLPIIAVTGSTGKTTTKDIIAEVLSRELSVLKNFGTHNNHIGVPQTIFKLNRSQQIAVLELGANHFGEISYLANIVQPQIAVITNIGAAHLEFFKNLEGVFKEKSRIIKYLKKPRIVLLNGDDHFLRKIKLSKEFRAFYFGVEQPCDFRASRIFFENNRTNFIFNKKHNFSLQTLGKFNVYNALVAIGCGLIFGISIKDIKETLNNFQFPEGRFNKINCSKFIILNDAYNSNPLSLKMAIESLVEFKTKGRRILVIGDMLELGSQSQALHKQIGSFIAQRPIDILLTLGKLSKNTAEAAKSKFYSRREIFSFDSKKNLTDFLKDIIQPNDIILVKGSRLMQMEGVVSSLINNK